jgi:unsaturated rhamnogalacturonyl hydrolase
LNRFIKVDPTGVVSITEVCAVAGLGGNPYRDGSYDYYIHEQKRDNDPKAVGPFIMMALEFETRPGKP